MFAPRNVFRAFQSYNPRINPSRIPRIPLSLRHQSRGFFTTPSRSARYYQRSNQSHSYSRFQNTTNAFYRWSQRPTFYLEAGGVAAGIGGFYVYNLETVPVSGRKRFNIFGPEYEKEMAQGEASTMLNQFGGKLLSDWDPRVRQVKRVINRLIPVSGLADLNWEVYVVESEMVNAMVVPGGKVFVFTGILPIAKDDDGLAAILGHEISHAVARHVSEKLSRYAFVWLGAVLSDFLFGTGVLGQVVLQYALEMPNGRKQETEADYLGLLLMAQACYDPQGAIRFWERMAKQGQAQPPEFLSTHPAPAHRVEKMREWMPEAEAKRASSDCGTTLGYAREFREALPQIKW
jgi:predicted Zn-dependent protease